MGRGASHLSPPLGNPLVHAASLPHGGRGAPDLRPGSKPPADDGGSHRSVRAGPQLPIRHAAVTKVRKQIPALAALVTSGGKESGQDMAHADLSPLWRQWLKRSYSRLFIGSTKWPIRVVPAGKPKSGKHWRPCKAPFASMHSPNACLHKPAKSGTGGRPSG